MTKTDPYYLRVTLFGTVTLENRLGRLQENPSRQAKPWRLFKYLLVNRGREVTLAELNNLWPDFGTENAARVRLNRLREDLDKLGLGGKNGLVQFAAGAYRINPRYALDVDEDRLNDLLTRFWTCPEQDPAGLQLAMAALTLFDGPFLDKSADPWVEPHREKYRGEFVRLAREILHRCRVQGDDRALSLLHQRSQVMAPGDDQLQRDIRGYLVSKYGKANLPSYAAAPQPKRRKEKSHEIVKKIIIEEDKVFFISAASDRRPLCYAKWEVLPLSRAYQQDGLHGLLTAVARGIHRGSLRTRADSRITRAIRKPLHAMGLETFLDMEEDRAVELLAELTEKVIADPDYDPAPFL